MRKVLKTLIKVIIGISFVAAVISFFADSKPRKNIGKNHIYSSLYEKYFKRPLDVFLSVAALIMLSPIMLITGILVRVKLGSPIIFCQERPGMIDATTGKEKIFKLYKFRTMTSECDRDGNLLSDTERLTEFGKLLRATSLDELPELVNIIKGDMSIVGPRPLLVKYLDRYSEKQRHRHDVRPGLTGYAQAHGRNLLSWDERFEMDVWYTNNVSFFYDIKIVIDTISIVLTRTGISSDTSVTMDEFLGDVR